VRFLFGTRPPPPPHVPLLGVATVSSTLLALASAPPRERLSRALCCGCASDIRLCFAHLRSGATVEAAQSAAGGTRPLRRRGWPSPTRAWNRQTLLAYPSRPPNVLQLIQQPEGHSAFLLFLFRLFVLYSAQFCRSETEQNAIRTEFYWPAARIRLNGRLRVCHGGVLFQPGPEKLSKLQYLFLSISAKQDFWSAVAFGLLAFPALELKCHVSGVSVPLPLVPQPYALHRSAR